MIILQFLVILLILITLIITFTIGNIHQIDNLQLSASETPYVPYSNIPQLNDTVQDVYDLNFQLKVIDLIGGKYNYTKHEENIDIYNFMEVEKIEMSQQSKDCINHIKVNSLCQLNDNISFKIGNLLGAGRQSSVYDATIINDQNSNDTYVLKQFHYHHLWSSNNPCAMYESEYRLLKQIEHYGVYYNLSTINIPFIHPSIPLYQSANSCLVFTQQIPNAITFADLLINATNFLPFILHKKGNIMRFLIDCYKDIMDVFYVLYQLNVYHNDVKSVNIVINGNTAQCYVIDFGNMIPEQNLYACQNLSANRCTFSCHVGTCSPVAWYYLHRKANRIHRFYKRIKEYYLRSRINSKTKGRTALFTLSIYAKQYEVATLLFHTFITFYGIQMHTEYAHYDGMLKMNDEIILWEKKGYGQMHKMTDDPMSVWCTRYQLYQKLLNQIANEKYTMHLANVSLEFMGIISIIEDDSLFLNLESCNMYNM